MQGLEHPPVRVTCHRLAAPRTVQPPWWDLVMSHVSGPRRAAPSTNARRANAAASSRSAPYGGSEAPESRQGSESQQLLPWKRQRRRATFIQAQLHRSMRAHNAPLLPPPRAPPSSFRGQRERLRSSLEGSEGVKATANGRGASSIAPPRRGPRTLLGQLCASAGGLVQVLAERHVYFIPT